MAALVAANRLRRVQPPAIEHELVAGDEMLDVGRLAGPRLSNADWAMLVIDRRQGFGHMQLSRATVCSNPVPIK